MITKPALLELRSQELKKGGELLENKNLPGQAVFLIKNGCANTEFNLKSLRNCVYLAAASEKRRTKL
jgi:hypothetical protein